MELGFLSLWGEFIAADYLGHISKAEEICEKYYPGEDTINPEEFLINNGWAYISYLKFLGQGYIVLWDLVKMLTYAQKTYLRPRVEAKWDNISAMCKLDLQRELELELSFENESNSQTEKK